MRPLEPTDALRLLNGGPVVLLTSRFRNETNVMPAIWTVPLSRRPPFIGVAVNQARHTHDMVRFAEEFALNFPGRELLNHTHYFGMVSGANVGKLELAKLPTFNASKIMGGAASQAIADLYVPGERQGLHPIWGRVTFNLVRDAGLNMVHEFWPDIHRELLHRFSFIRNVSSRLD